MKKQPGLLRYSLVWGGGSALLLLVSCHGMPRSERIVQRENNTQHPNITTRSGTYHEVKSGQTLWGIARAYGVNVQILTHANQLNDAATLYSGQKLYIPGVGQAREVGSSCPCPSESPSLVHDKPIGTYLRSPGRSPIGRFASSPDSLTKDSALENFTLIWPVYGEVSRAFEQEATRRHDGIDIMARQGAPIRAAADGAVMFSGWGPGGYGRTVIIQHQEDLVTVYAHNHENLVQVGQKLRQGDSIATVGQSGRATGNHLHFEVRYKALPLSPYKFLPRRPNNVAVLEHDEGIQSAILMR